jgi:predicted RNA binding protein YcfA (HicA-like mRNA interferase family)
VRGRLPALTPAEVIRALERSGWRVIRQRGSHISLGKEAVSHIVTVPLHRKDLPRGTLRQIIKDAGLSVDEFFELV